LGCELYLRDDNDPLLKAAGHIPKEYAKYFHVTAHFQDQKAYEVGCKLLSEAPTERHGSEYKPIFTWDNLEELGAQNVTIGSSCLIGVVQRHLLDHDDPKMAEAFYQKIRGMVKPKNFIVEAFPHVCDRNWIQGVKVRTNAGDKIAEHMFRFTKNLKTNVGEIYAEDLAREFHLKGNKHTHLLAIRDRRNWLMLEPQALMSVDKIEDFVVNECTSTNPDGDVQRGCNQFVLEMAKKYGDPILVSDDSHMATREYKVAQDVKLMAGGGAWRFHTEYFRMSSMDAWSYFDSKLQIPFKEFERWIDNSYQWASTFDNFQFNYKPELPIKFYPANTIEHLKGLIKKHGRMKWDNKVYIDRLQTEIALFHNNGTVDLLAYFFCYEEICSLYEKKGKLTGVGRGSAAGTLIAYLLGITHIDPIVHDLSLNRFITLDRIMAGTFPDIDLDLPSRDLLVGGEKEVLECETEDGRTVYFDKGQLVHTKTGVIKIEDAIREGVEIEDR
jgi:DNA polymerase III alpha subunit